MNAIQHVLLTVGLMAVGFVAYHALASEPAADSDALVVVESGDLERRIQALESAEEEGPALRPMVALGDAPERIARLEKRVATLEQSRRGATPEYAPGSESPHPDGAMATSETETDAPESVDATTELDKKVQDAVARLRRTEATARVNGVLDRLGIKMTEKQRQKFDAALQAHRDAVHETIGKARAEGLPRSEVRPLIAALSSEFSTSLQAFLPAADADAIASQGRALVGPPPG